ncbi:MAG: hypothetical protein Q8M83_00655 [bacterium]|nr:hypothetical protein [bacterium]
MTNVKNPFYPLLPQQLFEKFYSKTKKSHTSSIIIKVQPNYTLKNSLNQGVDNFNLVIISPELVKGLPLFCHPAPRLSSRKWGMRDPLFLSCRTTMRHPYNFNGSGFRPASPSLGGLMGRNDKGWMQYPLSGAEGNILLQKPLILAQNFVLGLTKPSKCAMV